MDAMACSTRRCFRPSAPASMRRLSRAGRLPNRPLTPTRIPGRQRRPPRPSHASPPPKIERMNAPAPEAASSTVCARLDRVSKLFGSFAALRQVTVELEAGRGYVLLGENGAGKSTLLRILAGLLRPSFGTVKVLGGHDPHQARERIGYMSHAPMLYDELTAKENLRYFASLYPGRPCLTPAEALRQVGLDPELNRTLGQYSQGMRQRTYWLACCCRHQS